MALTVKQLKKNIKGLPDDMPVYIADHDHAEWETNSIANYADIIDQSKLDKYAKEAIKKEPMWKINKPYLVIRP